jgi:hypothetical protein
MHAVEIKNVKPVPAATGLFIAPAAYAKVHRVGCVQPRRPHLWTRESWAWAMARGAKEFF